MNLADWEKAGVSSLFDFPTVLLGILKTRDTVFCNGIKNPANAAGSRLVPSPLLVASCPLPPGR
jgi:hypothetical protein